MKDLSDSYKLVCSFSLPNFILYSVLCCSCFFTGVTQLYLNYHAYFLSQFYCKVFLSDFRSRILSKLDVTIYINSSRATKHKHFKYTISERKSNLLWLFLIHIKPYINCCRTNRTSEHRGTQISTLVLANDCTLQFMGTILGTPTLTYSFLSTHIIGTGNRNRSIF